MVTRILSGIHISLAYQYTLISPIYVILNHQILHAQSLLGYTILIKTVGGGGGGMHCRVSYVVCQNVRLFLQSKTKDVQT